MGRPEARTSPPLDGSWSHCLCSYIGLITYGDPGPPWHQCQDVGLDPHQTLTFLFFLPRQKRSLFCSFCHGRKTPTFLFFLPRQKNAHISALSATAEKRSLFCSFCHGRKTLTFLLFLPNARPLGSRWVHTQDRSTLSAARQTTILTKCTWPPSGSSLLPPSLLPPPSSGSRVRIGCEPLSAP